jgi:hypothetical protein
MPAAFAGRGATARYGETQLDAAGGVANPCLIMAERAANLAAHPPPEHCEGDCGKRSLRA